MKCRFLFLGLAWAGVATWSTSAHAASSFSNSLTGFTGASPDPAVQSALAAAGLELSSTAGLAEDFSSDPSVNFDASGATFGALYAGDGGRNYVRTIDSYAFDSYVAEVTVVVDTLGTDVVFFGMGSGNISLWGTPDFAGVPFVFMAPEGGSVKTNAADGISGDWMDPTGAPTNDWQSVAAPGLVSTSAGTHRLRMTFDAVTKQWTGAVDVDYAGGPFTVDATTQTFDLTNAFDDGGFILNGWPTNPSKIFFGGDDGAIFKDFTVTVGGAPTDNADFNGDGTVDGADLLTWQRGFGSGATAAEGDADGNGMVNGADLAIWNAQYGGPPAGGAVAAAAPEPGAAVLAALAGGALLACRRTSPS
ncbi:MAG: hypothetical protein KF847_19565 [Pirellulales bacterium]|nr:hypothetical protein [Pirellulales bacterium]